MKPKSKDTAEGKMRKVKVNIWDDICQIAKSIDLETESKAKMNDGTPQAKLGQVVMDVSSADGNALVARPVAGP